MWFSKPKIFSKQQIVIYIAYSHIAIVQHGRSHPSGDIFAVSLSNKIWMSHGPGWFRVMCFFLKQLVCSMRGNSFFPAHMAKDVPQEVERRCCCRGSAQGLVVVPCHGMLEHGGTNSTLDPQLWAMAFAFVFFMFRGSGTRTGEGFRMNQGMHWHFQDGNRLLMAGRRHLQQQDFFLCQGKMVNRRCRWMELIWESRKA